MALTAHPSFCTACGASLSQGARFCEQCGQQVEEVILASSPVHALQIPVVVPFGTTQTGIFSFEDLVLVITADSLVAVIPIEEVARKLDRIQEDLSAALEETGISARDFWEVSAHISPGLPRPYLTPRQVPVTLLNEIRSIRTRIGLDQAPWLRYAGMTPAEILAESPDSRITARGEILYVRGEDQVADRYGEDLLVIRTRDREDRYRFSLGSYYPARSTLISRLEHWQLPALPGEQIQSIVPACFEPGPKDFDFQYVFNLLFTDRRLILATTSGTDEEVERQGTAYMEKVGQMATQQGMSPEAFGAASEWRDAPWQEFRQHSVHEILDSDGVNFFIPHSILKGVSYKPGRRPALTLSLPEHTLTLEADPLFSPGPLRAAQASLRGVLSITI